MVAVTHLAETSVLTRLKNSDVYAVVEKYLNEGRIARCTSSDLELGFSARNAAEWDAVNRGVRVFEPVDVLPQDHRRACGVQRALAEEGLKGRKVPDLLIAAAAEREGLVLLHYDRDFDLIADMTGQPCEWVVKRGSIE